MTAIERAYQIKKAMRRDFNVDHDLAGKELAASLTRACKAARSQTQTQTQLGYG